MHKVFYKSPSEDLLGARRRLDELDSIRIQKDFQWDPELKVWILECSIQIKSYSQELVPNHTNWFILIDDKYPFGNIKFYPSKRGGLRKTFPHQNFNGEGNEATPWRTGDLCLNTDLKLFRRLGIDYEAYDAEDRLLWHFKRVIAWLERASEETLLAEDDPFELPYFPVKSLANLYFNEDSHTLLEWQNQREKFGYTDLYLLDNVSEPTLVVGGYYTKQFEIISERSWGDFVSNNVNSTPTGIWVLLEDVPVSKPWHAPSTWGELNTICSNQNVDLMAIIKNVAPKLRDGQVHILSIGFPIPSFLSKPYVQIHWAAIELPKFTNDVSLTKGFRSAEKAFWWNDLKKNFAASEKVKWMSSENWNKEEITTRGRISAEDSSSVLLLGAGAVGSMVANQLVRATLGRMTIMDRDILKTGNLVRHTLTMKDIGKSKAKALAEHLSNCSPHTQIKHINEKFPLGEQRGVDLINEHQVILDCTGEDEVIQQLGEFKWTSLKKFISISIGYEARRLFVYMSEGQVFHSESFFKLIKPWMEKERELTKGVNFPREGIGCWHPIFPARGDDLCSVVSVAIKNIEQAIIKPVERPTLLVYEQMWDNELYLGTRLISREEYHE